MREAPGAKAVSRRACGCTDTNPAQGGPVPPVGARAEHWGGMGTKGHAAGTACLPGAPRPTQLCLTPDPTEDGRDRLEGDGASTYPLGKPESPSGSADSPSIIQEPEQDKAELKQGPAQPERVGAVATAMLLWGSISKLGIQVTSHGTRGT